jgi:hypothetical protein
VDDAIDDVVAHERAHQQLANALAAAGNVA